jgi:hypothetical protein
VETHNVETSAAVERESPTHTASTTHTKAVSTTHTVTTTHPVSTTHTAAVSTATVSTATVSTATAAVSTATAAVSTATAGRCNSWGKSDRRTDCGGDGNGDERFSKHGSVSSLERTSATKAILTPAADWELNA